MKLPPAVAPTGCWTTSRRDRKEPIWTSKSVDNPPAGREGDRGSEFRVTHEIYSRVVYENCVRVVFCVACWMLSDFEEG